MESSMHSRWGTYVRLEEAELLNNVGRGMSEGKKQGCRQGVGEQAWASGVDKRGRSMGRGKGCFQESKSAGRGIDRESLASSLKVPSVGKGIRWT